MVFSKVLDFVAVVTTRDRSTVWKSRALNSSDISDIDRVVDNPARTAPKLWRARGIVTPLLLRPAEAPPYGPMKPYQLPAPLFAAAWMAFASNSNSISGLCHQAVDQIR